MPRVLCRAVAICFGLVGLGCSEVPNAQQNDSAIATLTRRSWLTPVGAARWEADLLFVRRDQMTAGDAGKPSCDSTGLYTLSQAGVVRALATGQTVCQRLWFAKRIELGAERNQVLFVDGFAGQRLLRFDLATGVATNVAADCRISDEGAYISPDGTRLAFVGSCLPQDSSTLYLMELLRTNSEQAPSSLVRAMPAHISWAPDGKYLVLDQLRAGEPDSMIVVDVKAGKSHRILPGSFPSWSPDGRSIAYLHSESTQNHGLSLRVVDASGSHERVLLSSGSGTALGELHEEIAYQEFLWTNGERIVVSSGASLWSIDLGASRPKLLHRIGRLSRIEN
jgi:Tol biopolymer transport system component